MNGNISQMLVIAVMGIFMVFAVLSILWAVIEIMHFFVSMFEKRKTQPKKEVQQKTETPAPAPAAEITPAQDDAELVAVITAAIAAAIGTPASGFRIKSFRRIGASAPVWNTVSRKQENM